MSTLLDAGLLVDSLIVLNLVLAAIIYSTRVLLRRDKFGSRGPGGL